jgi:hypothetical protein
LQKSKRAEPIDSAAPSLLVLKIQQATTSAMKGVEVGASYVEAANKPFSVVDCRKE